MDLTWEELVVFPFRVVGLDNLDFNIKCHGYGGSTCNKGLGDWKVEILPNGFQDTHFNNHDQNCVLFLVPSFGASSLELSDWNEHQNSNSCDRYKLQVKAMGVEKSTKYTISWGDIELVPKNRQFRGFQFARVFDAFSMDISHISWWFVGG